MALAEVPRREPRDARVPPHNLDAEESLLGAMLLSRDAIVAATEVGLTSGEFYKPAHGHIFDAVTTLYAEGQPADPVTVAEALNRAGVLDAIGGPAILLGLQGTTPATSNAARYARIIHEHALLRRLIAVAGEIAELGYSLPDDVVGAVDRAESLVFDVAQHRVSDTTKAIRDLLDASLTRLEMLYEKGDSITGLPSGYAGLDELMSGLQPSSLVIVGARPAMGKALAIDTPLPTPAGWTTMGEVAVGDQVLDELGRPCRVSYTSPVFLGDRCFSVVLDDGTAVVADADHRWLAFERTGDLDRPRIVTSLELHQSPGRWAIRGAEPLDLPELDVADPYDVGAETALRGGCLPANLLRASWKQRLALLQGVMDRAGSVLDPDGRVEVRLGSRRLAGQVRELAATLGHTPGEVMPACGEWRLTWAPLDPVFRHAADADVLEAALARRPRRLPWRQVVAVDEVQPVAVRCLAVDTDSHLFLAGRSMVPTHNTSFALGMASHAALEARRPVLFFSLEMSHLEITQRLLSSEARVDSKGMRNGKLSQSDWTKLSHAIGRLADAPLYIDDNPQTTVMEIRGKARRLKSRLGDLGLVVVDYLQLMTGRSSAENRQVEVSEISRGLKILARELECPVVALSQLSRGLEMRSDKRPMLADLRESGSLEQDADVVMFLYRDEVYNPESPDRGTAEVLVSKHRSGPTGVDKLTFINSYTKFANMARGM